MRKLFTLAALLISTVLPAQHLIFLHNRFLEDHPPSDAHPSFGVYEYDAILAYLRKEGLTVIAPRRGPGADVETAARLVARTVDSLIKAGVKPSAITVAGASKGGFIAAEVSRLLKNRELNFVLVASCSEEGTPLYGRVLTISEKSDQTGTCPELLKRSKETLRESREMVLRTGLGHGFQFKASQEWLQPMVRWARGKGQ